MPEWSRRRQYTQAMRLWHKRRGSIDQLLAGKSQLTYRHREDVRFLEAFQEAAAYHYLRSPEGNPHPCEIRSLSDALRLPTAPPTWEPQAPDCRRLSILQSAILGQLRAQLPPEGFGADTLGVQLLPCRQGNLHLPRSLRLLDGHWWTPYPKSAPRLLISAPGLACGRCSGCQLSAPIVVFTER